MERVARAPSRATAPSSRGVSTNPPTRRRSWRSRGSTAMARRPAGGGLAPSPLAARQRVRCGAASAVTHWAGFPCARIGWPDLARAPAPGPGPRPRPQPACLPLCRSSPTALQPLHPSPSPSPTPGSHPHHAHTAGQARTRYCYRPVTAASAAAVGSSGAGATTRATSSAGLRRRAPSARRRRCALASRSLASH